MKTLAWTGIVLVLASTLPTFLISVYWITSPSMRGEYDLALLFTVPLAVLGTLMALPAGYFARSRTIALGLTAAGAVSLLPVVLWIAWNDYTWVTVILTVILPGILCLTGGLALLASTHRGRWLVASLAPPVILLVAVNLFLTGAFSYNAPQQNEKIMLEPFESGGGELVLENTGSNYRLSAVVNDGSTWTDFYVDNDEDGYFEVSPQGTKSSLENLGPIDKPIDAPLAELESAIVHPYSAGFFTSGRWFLKQGNVYAVKLVTGKETRYTVFIVKEAAGRLVVDYVYK